MGKHKAVFLDRDGTINIEKEYLSRVEDFHLVPGAPWALKRLQEAGFLLVVVTNQSGIGRGYYTEDDLEQVHGRMHLELGSFGVTISACYVCPHHPEHGVGEYRVACACRKPLPGMLIQAARDLDIDLAASFMIGDKLSDVEAGLRAGCSALLVLTGYGASSVTELPEGVKAYPDLVAAADAIVGLVSPPAPGAC